MILDVLTAAIARAARDAKAYAASVDILDDFRLRPFILGIAAGLIAPTVVRLLAWVL